MTPHSPVTFLFVEADACSEREFRLDEANSRHARKVLRLRPDDLVHLTDGHGARLVGRIVSESGPVSGPVVEFSHEPRPLRPILAFGLGERPRMEWLVEKAVELGVSALQPVDFGGKPDWELRRNWNPRRVEAIARAALCQSLGTWLPELRESVGMDELAAMVGPETWIADAEGTSFPTSPPDPLSSKGEGGDGMPLLIVGPPEGISGEFVDRLVGLGASRVSLGSNRLRTETAAIAILVLYHALRR